MSLPSSPVHEQNVAKRRDGWDNAGMNKASTLGDTEQKADQGLTLFPAREKTSGAKRRKTSRLHLALKMVIKLKSLT